MSHDYSFTVGMLCLTAGMAAPVSAEESILLAKPEHPRINVAASPEFDDRVFVYRTEPLSVSIREHSAGSQKIARGVGARDGVRFGNVFNSCVPNSHECVGIAKVMELEGRRCIAQVVAFDKDKGAPSVTGCTAVCAAPKMNAKKRAILCCFGKDVWQSESFENRLIRGLLESGGDQIQILIQQAEIGDARQQLDEM